MMVVMENNHAASSAHAKKALQMLINEKITPLEAAHGEEHDASHDEHLLHQLQNKPWAALYVAAFFLLYDRT